MSYYKYLYYEKMCIKCIFDLFKCTANVLAHRPGQTDARNNNRVTETLHKEAQQLQQDIK